MVAFRAGCGCSVAVVLLLASLGAAKAANCLAPQLGAPSQNQMKSKPASQGVRALLSFAS